MSENQMGVTVVISLYTPCAMEFLLKRAITEPCVNTFQSKGGLCITAAWMNALTGAQGNEVTAAPEMSLLASSLSLLRSTFLLCSSASGELGNWMGS